MREFKKLPLELFVGYDIEQNSRVIELDASEMVEKYPSGILQLVCKRPGEETTYIAPSFEQDGGTLRWTLTSYDVEKAGQGLAIVALVDTSGESVKVLASHKIRTGIEEGLHFRDAERVDPEDSLIARVLAAVSQAQAYAQDAKEEADRAEAAEDAVEDAKDQAISAIETKGTETLDSIPSDYTALSGDVSDLKSANDNIFLKYLTKIPAPIDGTGFVKYADGKITSSTVTSHTDYINVKGLSYIRFTNRGTTAASVQSGMAFYDKDKVYISGVQNALNQAETGYVIREADVPDSAVYARFSVYVDTDTYGEFELYGISVYHGKDNEIANAAYSPTGYVMQASRFTSPCVINGQTGGTTTSTSGRASLLNYYGRAVPMAAISVNLPGYLFKAFYYTGSAKETYTGCSDFVPCDGNIFVLPKTRYQYARFTFYHDPVDDVDFTAEELEALANAITLYDYAKNVPGSEEEQYIKRESAAMGLNTIPESIGMLNVIRRARQHTDVRWTPVADMKRSMLQSPNYTHPDEAAIATKDQRRRDDLFLSGKEYSGIPYTEVGNSKYEFNSTIGNLDSFVSAVQYANTAAYFTDNYIAKSQHSAKMGGTCVDVPLYAYELPRGHLDSWGSRFSSEVKNVFGTSYDDFQPELLQQGDIVDSPGHVVLITDIKRNELGGITGIEVSENTTSGNLTGEIGTNYGGKTRRWMWPLRDFYNNYGRHDYKVYRMKQAMIDRVTYTPLACVQIGTETKTCFDGALPLLPENGNKCILARGPKPYSNSLTDDVQLLIEKTTAIDGDATTAWNKIAVTDPTGAIQKYDITGDSLTVTANLNGVWGACPQVVNDNNEVVLTGPFTEWYVILLNSVTYTFDGAGGFELQVSHADTDDCEPVGFVMNSTGGVVLESIANYTCTSEVSNGIRTWTITGSGVSTNDTTIRHIAFRTPFGLAKCVSDRVY